MKSVDSKDISQLLRGDDKPIHEYAVTENPWSKAIRWKNWRFVHYQREMFDGQDVGELYDIDSDPDETKNLYNDPSHKQIVDDCRRLLLEWLISTTRIKTIWPGAKGQKPGTQHWIYSTAGDGKLTNDSGARELSAAKNTNYL